MDFRQLRTFSCVAELGSLSKASDTLRVAQPALSRQIKLLEHELRVELFEVLGAQGLPEERRQPNTDLRTHGNKHLAFAVQDADATAEVLKARGADIVFVGHFEFGSNVFIRDNAGNLIEFVQQPDMWSP